MPIVNIDHINIRAPRALVAEMATFYEEVLGLARGWRPPFRSTGVWLYLGATPLIHLVDDETIPARTARGPGVDHVAFGCTGLRAHEALLRAKEISFRRAEVPETALVQLFFTDPAGNGVELQFADAAA